MGKAQTGGMVCSLLFFFFLSFSALGSRCGAAEKAGEARADGKGKPNQSPPSLFFLFTAPGGFTAAAPNLPHSMRKVSQPPTAGPHAQETSSCTQNNSRGAGTNAGGGTVAPSHRPATAHAPPPTRDGRLKRHARTACAGPLCPRSGGDPRTTRGSALFANCDKIFPTGVPYRQRNFISRPY